MSNKNYLKMIDEEGNEVEYEILCAYKLTETKKNYVIFTDNTFDVSGNLNVYASIYYPSENNRLESIETDEEWQEVENRLIELQNK